MIKDVVHVFPPAQYGNRGSRVRLIHLGCDRATIGESKMRKHGCKTSSPEKNIGKITHYPLQEALR